MKKGRPRESLESKFWKKIKKGNSENDCWEWMASTFRGGYGQLTHGKKTNERKTIKGHRVSYELHFGKIPNGKLVCHSCDNPPCCNPKHLFLGSWKDNVSDIITKGRKADTRGEKNGQAKITMEIARKIRLEYSQNDPNASRYQRKKFSQTMLAKKYGISQTVVHDIVNNNYWRE